VSALLCELYPACNNLARKKEKTKRRDNCRKQHQKKRYGVA